MLIDCGLCAMHHTSACDDCVVTFLLATTPVDLDDEEAAALDNLASEGLVPKLRLIPTEREAG